MFIARTAYKSNANGRGQIVAKGRGKQRTVNYDHATSAVDNHARAVFTFVTEAFPEDVEAVKSRQSKWTHDVSDKGVHTWNV